MRNEEAVVLAMLQAAAGGKPYRVESRADGSILLTPENGEALGVLGRMRLANMLSLLLNSEDKIRACPVCSSSIPISPGVGRADKRYCSDACRIAALRKRKAERKAG